MASDTATINLIKDYQLGSTSGSNTSTFHFKITPYGVWNAGSSTGVADGDAYDKTNMPMPSFTGGSTGGSGNTRYTTASITATSGTTGNASTQSAAVTLPTYNSVGDFWYLVQETATNVSIATDTEAEGLRNTGVVYGTNDTQTENKETENFAHDGKYYMHVQVVNAGSGSGFCRSVTLHKTAPTGATNAAYNNWASTNYAAADKVNNIQNKYYAGSLSVAKAVEGNAADKDKRFEVTVVFTKPANTIINSDITYSAVDTKKGTNAIAHTLKGQTVEAEEHNWMTIADTPVKAASTTLDSLTNTVTFWIKDGDTVTFNNIPYGVTYTVTESDPNGTDGANNSYLNKIVNASKDPEGTWSGIACAVDSDSPEYSPSFSKQATGSIADASDTVTITNKKDVSIDIGVITSNAPYIAMLAILAGAAALFIFRRKRISEV